MGARADQAIAELNTALENAAATARAVPPEALRYTPGGDEWPIDRIVRHMGTGALFRIDLERTRGGGSFSPTLFEDYTAKVNAVEGQPVETILSETTADFRTYQEMIRGLSDEQLDERFTVTMPSGRQLDLSTADNVQQVINHTNEHIAQIKDWLARRGE